MMQASDIFGVIRDLLAPARRLGTLALAAIIVVALGSVWLALPIFSALRAAPGKAPTPVAEETLAKSVEEFDKLLASSSERVNARAPFGAVKVAAKPEPKPLVAARYGGPALVGMAADEAWFAEGKRVKVGATEFGINVVALDPPWGAKVRWGGGEFTVSLFDRAPISMSQPLTVWQGAPPPPPPPPAPKPATPPPVAAATAPPGGAPGASQAPGQPGQFPPGGPQAPPANVPPLQPEQQQLPPPGQPSPNDNARPQQNAPPPPPQPQPEPEQRAGATS